MLQCVWLFIKQNETMKNAVEWIVFLMFLLLRKEVGLDLFFPQELINSMKVKQIFIVFHSCRFSFSVWDWSVMFSFGWQPKHLRKLIQQTFQQYSSLKEEQCMMKFFETFSVFSSFDEEVFPCELVVRPLLLIYLCTHPLFEIVAIDCKTWTTVFVNQCQTIFPYTLSCKQCF